MLKVPDSLSQSLSLSTEGIRGGILAAGLSAGGSSPIGPSKICRATDGRAGRVVSHRAAPVAAVVETVLRSLSGLKPVVLDICAVCRCPTPNAVLAGHFPVAADFTSAAGHTCQRRAPSAFLGGECARCVLHFGKAEQLFVMKCGYLDRESRGDGNKTTSHR